MPGKMQAPDGWRVMRLGDVTERVSRLRGDLWPEPTILSCSKDHGLIPQLDLFQKRLAALDTHRYKIVHPGEFVYDPNLLWSGAITRSQQETIGIVSPVYEVFKTIPECSQEFLYAWLTLPGRLSSYRSISMGTNIRRRRADFGDFAKLPIPLPPLAEQRSIAAVLDAIDDAIERAEAVVAATERLRDALLYELLTRGVPGWHSAWREVPGVGVSAGVVGGGAAGGCGGGTTAVRCCSKGSPFASVDEDRACRTRVVDFLQASRTVRHSIPVALRHSHRMPFLMKHNDGVKKSPLPE